AVVGGKLNAFGSNARLGKGEWSVVEAGESDGSFLHLTPTIAVVTNVDPEHLDHYGTVEALQQAFVDFADRVPFYGLVVLCLDHPTVQHLIPRLSKRHVTYGISPQADWRADEVKLSAFSARFAVWHRAKRLGEVVLKMVGAHNVLNALAACAVAHELGIPFERTAEALGEFAGVQRRFTVRGEAGGVLVVDDYGHHPAEIRATLLGARASFPQRRIVCAFQPHRYSRTRDLMGDFATAFNDADVLILGDIYAAGEEPIPGVSGEKLHAAVRACGPAQLWVRPRDPDALVAVLGVLCDAGVPWFALGGGANTVVGDGGVEGAVLKLAPGFAPEQVEEGGDHALLTLGAGAPIARFVSL